MSLFGSLNSATAGLRTVQAGLNVVSDNITRVNDPTRSRHTLEQKVNAGGLVVTAEYRREVDSGLKAQLESLTAREGRTQAQNDYMVKIGDLLRTSSGQPLLTKYADDFETAWKSLETSPESETAQYQAVQTANNFAREINRVATGVEQLDAEMSKDIADGVDEANRLMKDIDRINDDIVSLKSLGAAGNEAADRRDSLIKDLNKLIGVRAVERADGRVAIFTETGQALVDSAPAELSYTGGAVYMQVGNKQQDVTPHLRQGKIGALYDMRYDGSAGDNPKAASGEPTGEIIRKLRSQLDTLASAFTAKTKEGEPTSFADAYNNARPTGSDEQAGSFFAGKDRFSLAVNDKLLDNSKKIKVSAISDVVKAFTASGRSYTPDGINEGDMTYGGMVNALTGKAMEAAAVTKDRLSVETESRTVIEERYRGNVGVNMDEEIALLQQLQTSYAASARVMQVTNKMFDTLEAIVG
jgi:flagellar hook-associated protein 1